MKKKIGRIESEEGCENGKRVRQWDSVKPRSAKTFGKGDLADGPPGWVYLDSVTAQAEENS